MKFNSRSKLEAFLRQQCQQAVLLATTPEYIAMQNGQTCKLYALSHAMAVYQKFIPNLPAARKADVATSARSSVASLRRQAKTRYESVVGEVYNPYHLERLAKNNQMTGTRVHQPKSSTDYINRIKKSINHNHSALVFFDVSVSGSHFGNPIKKRGEFEHAAAVFGYCHYKKELYFIVGQWGEFYLHKAVAIAESAMQIDKRIPEIFYKFKSFPFMKPAWAEHHATRTQIEAHWFLKYFNSDGMLAGMCASALETRIASASTKRRVLGRTIFEIHPDPTRLLEQLTKDFDKALDELDEHVRSSKRNSKRYPALTELVETLRTEKANFKNVKTAEASVLKCLQAIDAAEKHDAFGHESPLVFRVMRKIALVLAIILSAGIAAYLKRQYSYKTTGSHSVLFDITKTAGKANKLREVLRDHTPKRFAQAHR